MRATATQRSKFTHDVKVRAHQMTADEPADHGGDDLGPSPRCSRAGAPGTAMVEARARRRQGFTYDVEVAGHGLVFDEPAEAGGADLGPSPTRSLAAALAACTAITVEMYAKRKGWDVGDLEVRVEMEYGEASVPNAFGVELRFPSELSSEQIDRLRVIASKCPVHRALRGEREVTITDRVELV